MSHRPAIIGNAGAGAWGSDGRGRTHDGTPVGPSTVGKWAYGSVADRHHKVHNAFL